jgi:hypothetical protein
MSKSCDKCGTKHWKYLPCVKREQTSQVKTVEVKEDNKPMPAAVLVASKKRSSIGFPRIGNEFRSQFGVPFSKNKTYFGTGPMEKKS